MDMRHVIEFAARRIVLVRTASIGDQKARFFVTPGSQLRYALPGEHHLGKELLEIARHVIREGDVVWDVGANCGVFGLSAALKARTVLLIEPDAWLSSLLQRSAGFASYLDKDLRILTAAVAERSGIESLLIARRGRASNSLQRVGGHETMGGSRAVVSVPVFSIDRLAQSIPAPTFIKIDVEGAEQMALEGAARTLQRDRPIVYIEVHRERMKHIRKIASDIGYYILPRDLAADPPEIADYFLCPTSNDVDRLCRIFPYLRRNG